MNKKIEMITDRAESVNENKGAGNGVLSSNSGGGKAPPGAIKSPEFHTTGEQIKI